MSILDLNYEYLSFIYYCNSYLIIDTVTIRNLIKTKPSELICYWWFIKLFSFWI